MTRSGTISCFDWTHLRLLALGGACAEKLQTGGDREPQYRAPGPGLGGMDLSPWCRQASTQPESVSFLVSRVGSLGCLVTPQPVLEVILGHSVPGQPHRKCSGIPSDTRPLCTVPGSSRWARSTPLTPMCSLSSGAEARAVLPKKEKLKLRRERWLQSKFTPPSPWAPSSTPPSPAALSPRPLPPPQLVDGLGQRPLPPQAPRSGLLVCR